MIINYIRNGDIRSALLMLLAVVISLTVHEYAHAFTAHKCGDNTAYAYGRMSLNPLKHIDLFGFIAMLFLGFGWAKPVPVNMRGLKNPRRDIALVSLAGPVSNFLMAFIAVGLMRLWFFAAPTSQAVTSAARLWHGFFDSVTFLLAIFAILNVGLGLFNLIPIPPLDGSKVLASLLPPKWGYKFIMLERYTPIFMMVIFALSYFDAFDPLFYPLIWLRAQILHLFTLPFFFGAYAPF